MSLALAPHEIRVNAIGPGSIQTQVLQAVATNEAAKNRHAFLSEACLVCCMAHLGCGIIITLWSAPAYSELWEAACSKPCICKQAHYLAD